ncbi:antigen like protein [Clarias magur]|uniref:Antigen like protein n=1 Tax=Clarias magur TaxID=1594786 RepID=A0A8J4UUY2_CLAMG|nr:antigen like protein [Clarias magur]
MRPGVPFIVLLLMVRCHTFKVRETSVNEPVTLPCTCHGNSPVVEWTRFIPSSARIANCQSQTCQIEEDYRERFEVSKDATGGNYSMRINPTAYNDGGSYRCTCNGNKVTEVKLRVYFALAVNAFVGTNITLPCYGDTRRDAKDAQWRKDGVKLLEYPGVITNASGSKFAMSESGFKRGDLSLYITSVQKVDAGFYRCLIQGESRDGVPAAVLLKVEVYEPQPTPTSYEGLATVVGVVLGLVLLVGIVRVIAFCVRKTRRQQNASPTPISGVPRLRQEEDELTERSSLPPVHMTAQQESREEGRIDVVFPGVEKHHACCTFMCELLKCLLYQRQQLPMTRWSSSTTSSSQPHRRQRGSGAKGHCKTWTRYLDNCGVGWFLPKVDFKIPTKIETGNHNGQWWVSK